MPDRKARIIDVDGEEIASEPLDAEEREMGCNVKLNGCGLQILCVVVAYILWLSRFEIVEIFRLQAERLGK